MITSSHAIIYAEDPHAARGFFRDVLGLAFVDAHEGWLIFKLPPAELGIHPAEPPETAVPAEPPETAVPPGTASAGGESGGPGGASPGHHELFLMCDDIEATVADLTAKGVEFSGGIQEERFGRLVRMRIPGAGDLGLYEPRHPTAYDLDG